MDATRPTRNWMKIATKAIAVPADGAQRSVILRDAESLAVLMDLAYRGTIDHEGETPEQCRDEMRGTLSGKYGPFLDFASFAHFENEKALSASLVTLWRDQPLLAFSMTSPTAQGRGLAARLIERSISALREHGYRDFYLVVTAGERSGRAALPSIGFRAPRTGPSRAATAVLVKPTCHFPRRTVVSSPP